MLFDDEENSYPGPSSDWRAMSCRALKDRSRQWKTVDWTEVAAAEGQQIWFTIRQKLRPRWWYMALVDCSETIGENESYELRYEVHSTNVNYGWAEEFSMDTRFTPLVFAMLLVAYGFLFAAQLHGNRRAAEQRAQEDSASGKAAHPFAQLLTMGVALALIESACSALHLALFAKDGFGMPWLQVLAQFMSVAANFVLASLLLLVSQGKCISYIMVASDAWSMLRLLGPFLVSCFALEMWGEHSVSRNYTTNYVYTTPVGWCLILVDVLLLCMYASGLRRTYLVERGCEHAVFYRTWGILYGAWFVVLPVTALLAQMVLAPYVWLIVSLGSKKGVTALLYLALVVGVWPGNTRTYFKLEGEVVESRQRLPGLLGSFLRRAPEVHHSASRKKVGLPLPGAAR